MKTEHEDDLWKEIQLYLSENSNGDMSHVMVWDAGGAVLRGKITAKLALQKKLDGKYLREMESLEKKI